MKKPMVITLICLFVLFGGIFGFKVFQSIMIKHYIANMKQVPTVSTMKVVEQNWQPQLQAAGSLRATRGVDVTNELSGIVQKIYFTPGSMVKEGDLILQLDADADVAQLHALQATASLNKITYDRDKKQYKVGAVSKATLDTDFANMKSSQASAEQQQANVNKKTIRAPFTGRLGVCQVNPGQYLAAGSKIVSLQTLDPIYVDFYVPQQEAVRLQVGQAVSLSNNAFPNQTFTGKITTIDPAFDPSTRNVEIEATIANSKEQLTPGMFATVTVNAGTPQNYITLPQTAVTFNPYGSIVYIVKSTPATTAGQPPVLTAVQTFVTTGDTRGDQIAILKGLTVGEEIVSSGQMKLRNNEQIQVNNSVVPANNPAPQLASGG